MTDFKIGDKVKFVGETFMVSEWNIENGFTGEVVNGGELFDLTGLSKEFGGMYLVHFDNPQVVSGSAWSDKALVEGKGGFVIMLGEDLELIS